MVFYRLAFILLICLVGLTEIVRAEENLSSPKWNRPSSKRNPDPDPIQLFKFRIFPLAVFQSSRDSFSLGASWNPRLESQKGTYFFGNLALAPVLGSDGNLFLSANYEVFFAIAFLPRWEIEMGVGAQTWFLDPVTTSGIFSLNFAHHFNTKLLSIFDRAFVGYSIGPAGSNPNPPQLKSVFVHQVRIGLEI